MAGIIPGYDSYTRLLYGVIIRHIPYQQYHMAVGVITGIILGNVR